LDRRRVGPGHGIDEYGREGTRSVKSSRLPIWLPRGTAGEDFVWTRGRAAYACGRGGLARGERGQMRDSLV
jgi:hypothetical protein